ncbi:MAG: carbohydrate ABC transporter permease [Treponema sp.]|nr:carbohydrate ABC transporter permease [Treponema sp.]MBP5747165.1 carbohydrate ABC transporter permease [Treponema sp.]
MNRLSCRYHVNVIKIIFLIIVCLFSVFPFYFMIIGATNKSVDIIKGKLTIGSYLIGNIKAMHQTVHMGRAFWNSLRSTVIGTFLSIFVCSAAGYGFCVFRDKYKDRLMGILLLSMMIPGAATMIPLFRMFSSLKLLNTVAAFIFPSISTAFLIFFFRQNSSSFPIELVQAARVDGLNEFQIYLRVYLPIMSPTFAAASIVTFMGLWNNYMWPLVVLQTQDMQTLPLLVTGLTAGYVTDYGLLMLCLCIMTIPIIILFFTQQRKFVEGITGSVK